MSNEQIDILTLVPLRRTQPVQARIAAPLADAPSQGLQAAVGHGGEGVLDGVVDHLWRGEQCPSGAAVPRVDQIIHFLPHDRFLINEPYVQSGMCGCPSSTDCRVAGRV
jgi:hypothetical protein